METNDHIISSCKQDSTWQELQQIISDWGRINDAKPGLIVAINTRIAAIEKGIKPSPPQTVDDEIQMAFQEQSKIG
eukprot:12529338-Ditylum_brightwellii.AAC.1